jgi:hypothetical protein
MRNKRAFMYIKVFVASLLIMALILSFQASYCAEDKVWLVHDIINPSLDQVNWSEEGSIDEPPSWIADGSWSSASMSQSLVGSNDIFVSTYEQFNWLNVKPTAEYWYGAVFSSFSNFQNSVIANPGPWLSYSWSIDMSWYGVSNNTTRVIASIDEDTSTVEIWSWFHITRTPEYLVGQGNLENWLTGFDLTPVSVGSLKLWELYRGYSSTGQYYSLRFEAPASIMSQHGDNYTCSLPVAVNYVRNVFKIQQIIDINMPAKTEIKETWPSNQSISSGNTASFFVQRGDFYPASFSVTSGLPGKSLEQTIQETAAVWFSTPGGWAAITTLLVLSITGLRGRVIWQRNKLYHHLYKSMVTVFDIYSKDLSRFNQEIDKISSSIFKLLVEDKITDEQFEKLLKRRDDLLVRAETRQPPQPPKT